ncbi:MAG TPA: MATE family efflux transporter [Candidatus Blautia stercoripullorum]|uniref:Probable multidrug resistance protein NorM n=1 Tax=Candidatus Blautia stercoripullorum TaxID=2838502 RepID=A0A9D2U374_9FIRM|nr:MATE family efflux transporter [Candidatus Blautia stercoripullorum]
MHLLTKRQNIDTKLIREINSTAIPLILSTVTGTVMGMMDQAFVGHISVYAYGGVGLVASCINSLIGVLGAFSIVFNIRGSHRRGEGDQGSLNRLFGNFLLLSLMAGMALCLGFALFSRPVLELGFGLHGETLTEAENYLQIFSLTIPLNLLLFIYSSVFKIFRKTGIIFLVSLGANLLNILLDYVLIFGHLGLPEMGTRGAALGTVTALAVNLGFYAFLGKDYVRFSRKDLSLEKMKQIFQFSLPFLGQETMEDILFVVGLNGIVARLGVTELAAYNLIAQFTNLILMPMFGYTAANTSLVSEWAGKGDRKQADKAGRYTFGLLCIWFAVFYVILVLGREEFIRLISPDTEVITLAAACMPLALLIQLLNYYGNVWKSSLQSLGWQNWTLRTAFIINLLVLGFMGAAAWSKGKILWIYLIQGLGYLGLSLAYTWKKQRRNQNALPEDE